MNRIWLDRLGDRIVTPRRVRAVAAISTAILLLTYGLGLARHQGLIDGFGHVIGQDLLAQRIASQMVRDGRGDRLYDFDLQTEYEQREVSPASLPGLDPFITPPYVALLYWPVMPLPLPIAFTVWTGLALASLVTSLFLLGGRYSWVTDARMTALL